MFVRKLGLVVFAALSVVLTGCNVQLDPNMKIDLNLKPLSCVATIPSDLNGIVNSGQPVPVTLKVTGGLAPYKLSSVEGSFGSELTISKTFTNTDTVDKVVKELFSAKDTINGSVSCELTVVVRSDDDDTTPSDLACSVSVSPTSPKVNEVFTVTVNSTGGTAPITFSNLNLGTDGVVVNSLTTTQVTTAMAHGKYTAEGVKNVVATVTDAANNITICSRPVTVRTAPTLTLSITPALSVPAGQSIEVTAIPSGFSGTVSYNFTESENGVSMVVNGNKATLSSSDGLAHSNFLVSVTATSGSDSASNSVTLSFSAAQTLNCTLTHSGGSNFNVNDTITFSVQATNGEPLEITAFYPDYNSNVVGTTLNTRQVKYTSTGQRTIYALAKSRNTGAACNLGAYLVDSVNISGGNPLSCSAWTSYNPSYPYEWVRAGATVPAGSGTGTIRLYSVCSTYQCYYPDTTSLETWINFTTPGVYRMRMTVKDSTNASAECVTDHIVY